MKIPTSSRLVIFMLFLLQACCSVASSSRINRTQSKSLASSVSQNITNLSQRIQLLVDTVPMPEALKTILSALPDTITTIPAGLNTEPVKKIRTVLHGMVTHAQLFETTTAQGTKGIRLQIDIPENLKPSDILPGLTAFEAFKLPQSTLIISNVAYKDEKQGVSIQPGCTLVSRISLDHLQATGIVGDFIQAIKNKIKSIILYAVLPKNLEEAQLNVVIPSDSVSQGSLKITDFIDITKIGLPEKVLSLLQDSALEFPQLSLRTAQEGQKVTLNSSLFIYGHRVATQLMLHNEPENQGFSLTIRLPESWKLSTYFPDVKKQLPSEPYAPRLILSTLDYEDQDLKLTIKKGLNFLGSIHLDDVPPNIITPLLKKISPVFSDLTVRVVIPEQLRGFKIDFALVRLDNKVLHMADLWDTSSTPMPNSLRTFIKNLAIIHPEFKITIEAKHGVVEINAVEMHAVALVDNQLIQLRMLFRTSFANDGNDNPYIPNLSLDMTLPMNWKFSDTFDNAGVLETLTITQPHIVLSNFEYDYPEAEVTIAPGVNFVSSIKLEGPLTAVKDFVDNVLSKFFAIDGDGEFTFVGTIGSSLSSAKFNVLLDARMGFDFDQMTQKKLLPFKMPLIKKITTDNFNVSFEGRIHLLQESAAAFSLQTGMRVFLRSQEDPLIMRAGVSVGATESSLEGSMDTMYDPAFGIPWLALDGLGIEIEFDYAILQATLLATGMPLPSGLGVRGAMMLGEGDDRTAMEVAGKMALSTTNIGALILHGTLEKLNLTQLVWLFSRMADKKVTLSALPPLNFEHVEAEIVPVAASIAGKRFDQGLYASAWINLFGLYGGLDLSVTKWGIAGRGILPAIDTPWFKLTAGEQKFASKNSIPLPSQETTLTLASAKEINPKEGPSFELDISLLRQRAMVQGMASLPYLGIAKEIEADISLSGLKFRVTEVWDLYETEFEVLATKEAAYVKGTMKQSALRAFEKLLTTKAQELVKKADNDLDKAKQKVADALRDLEILKQKIDKAQKQCSQ